MDQKKFDEIIEAGYFKFGNRIYEVNVAATLGNIANQRVPHIIIGTTGLKADIEKCQPYKLAGDVPEDKIVVKHQPSSKKSKPTKNKQK